jgi:hypothetical protein
VTLDCFLVDHLVPKAFDPPNYPFWVRTVIDATGFLGPQTDTSLERLTELLLSYHSGADMDDDTLLDYKGEILRPKGVAIYSDMSPLGLKYRSLMAVGLSRKTAKINDTWQYGVVTAFELINYGRNVDDSLIDLIRKRAHVQKVELYEDRLTDHDES